MCTGPVSARSVFWLAVVFVLFFFSSGVCRWGRKVEGVRGHREDREDRRGCGGIIIIIIIIIEIIIIIAIMMMMI